MDFSTIVTVAGGLLVLVAAVIAARLVGRQQAASILRTEVDTLSEKVGDLEQENRQLRERVAQLEQATDLTQLQKDMHEGFARVTDALAAIANRLNSHQVNFTMPVVGAK